MKAQGQGLIYNCQIYGCHSFKVHKYNISVCLLSFPTLHDGSRGVEKN